MRDIQILQQTIENQCPEIHKKRPISLILATKTVLEGSDLTLTKIGRVLDTDTAGKDKCSIKEQKNLGSWSLIFPTM